MKRRTRVLSAFMAFVMVFLMMPLGAITISATTSNDFDSTIEKYRLDAINGVTNQILFDYVADSFNTEAVEGSLQKSQVQKMLSSYNKVLKIGAAGCKILSSCVPGLKEAGDMLSGIQGITGEFIENDANKQLMEQLNAMSVQISELSDQIDAFAKANQKYLSDMATAMGSKADFTAYQATLQEFANDISGDDRFGEYQSYYSWQKELYKRMNAVILAEQKLENDEELSMPLAYYYDRLYLVAKESDDLYDYLTTTAFGTVTLPEVAYRYYLLNNVVNGKSLTYQEITELCIELSQDWYATYAMSQICLEMCYIYQLETIIDDATLVPPYDETDVIQSSVTGTTVEYDYITVYNFLIDPMKNIDTIKNGLASYYARILCLDESYIYEPCIYNDSSCSGEMICHTVRYEEILTASTERAEEKTYGYNLKYYSRTNNLVSTGDTLYMNMLPETFSNIFDASKISFVPSNPEAASVNNAGVVNVIGEAGNSFTINMLYDGIYVYGMEFKIVECNFDPISNTTIEVEVGAYLSGTYSNVNIQIADDNCEDAPAYIVLDGATITGSIYSSNSRPIYIISKGTENIFTAPNNTIAVNAPNAKVSIFGDAELTIKGGNATSGNAPSAILTSTFTVNGSLTLNVTGGNGYTGYSPSKADWNTNGSSGSDGGNGGIAISAKQFVVSYATVNIIGGNGGNGGRGGDANNGTSKRNGGKGGNGGQGAVALDIVTYRLDGATINVASGKGGNGGNGGRAGGTTSGTAGWGGDGGRGGNSGDIFYFEDNGTSIFTYEIGTAGSGGSGGYSDNSSKYGGSHGNGTIGMVTSASYNGHYYRLIKTSTSWESAKAACEGLGGHLVTITSEEEQNFVNSLVNKGTNYWIGASDLETEGTWAWVTEEDFIYTNWASGEPQGSISNEDYALLHASFDGQWVDTTSDSYYYICEWDDVDQMSSGHRYQLFNTPLTWEYAKAACEALGGHLVTITSEEENEFIRNLANGSEVWLGASETSSENVYSWVTGEEFSYTAWGSGEPNNSGGNDEDVILYLNGSWFDTIKSDAHYYICEWEDISDNSEPPADYVYGIKDETDDTKSEERYIRGETNLKYIVDGKVEKLDHSYGRIDTSSVTEDDAVITAVHLKSIPETSMYQKIEVPVTVDLEEAQELLIYTKPTVDSYHINSTQIDLTGLKLVVLYDNGKPIFLNDGEYETEFDFKTANSAAPVKFTANIGGQALVADGFKVTVTDHEWDDGEITTDSTHTAKGEKTYTCTVENCSVTRTEPIEKDPEHEFSNNWTKHSDTQHVRECTCGQKEYANHTWNSGIVTEEATHLKEGTTTYTCTACAATKTETIEKIKDHSYGEWTKLNGTQHKKACACGDEIIEAHDWNGGEETRPATSVQTGEMLYTCNSCSATKTETIPIIEVPVTDPQIQIGKKKAHAGETVTINITMKNVTALKSIMLDQFDYDKTKLELVDFEWKIRGAALSDWDATEEIATIAFSQNIDANGVIAELTFKVLESAEVGDVTVSCAIAANEKLEAGGEAGVSIYVVDGGVTIKTIMRGDVNGDDFLDSDDAIYLLRATLNPIRYPINQDGDMNGDGVLDSDDAIYILRHTLNPDRYPLS